MGLVGNFFSAARSSPVMVNIEHITTIPVKKIRNVLMTTPPSQKWPGHFSLFHINGTHFFPQYLIPFLNKGVGNPPLHRERLDSIPNARNRDSAALRLDCSFPFGRGKTATRCLPYER